MNSTQPTEPFIAAVESMFAEMLGMPITCSEPRIKSDDEPWLDITGTIGLTGSLTGAMALTFDRATAEGVVAEMVGMPMSFDDADMADAIGELANIVAGNAKAKLNSDGSLSITCPTVTRGACVTRLNRETEAVSIDLECPVGPLRLEVSLKTADADTDTRNAAA